MDAISYEDTTLDRALSEYPSTKKLVLTPFSGMSQVIGDRTQTHSRIRVRLAKRGSKVIGWGWVTPTARRNKQGTRCLSFMVLVTSGYRKQGIGKALFQWARQEARRQHRALIVFPWDERSKAFYRKVPVRNQSWWY